MSKSIIFQNLASKLPARALLLVLVLATFSDAHTPPTSSAVLDLDGDSLLKLLVDHNALVEFYTTWCGLCQSYHSEYEVVANAFAELNKTTIGLPSLVVGRVDIDQHKELAASFGVHSVPFITLLRKSRWYTISKGEMKIRPAQRYPGYLAAGPTIEYVNEVMGLNASAPVYVQELDEYNFEAVVADPYKDVLVMFYASWCGHCKEFRKYYYEVGVHFASTDHVLVARIDADTHRQVGAMHSIRGFPAFHLFRRGHKEKGLVFAGEQTPAKLIAFVNSPTAYLVEERVLAAQSEDSEEEERERWLTAFESNLGGDNDDDDDYGSDDDVSNGSDIQAKRAQLNVAAQRMFTQAYELAERQLWEEALEVLVRMQHDHRIRKTAVGSSPQMWNLLDNVKFHLEEEALQMQGGLLDWHSDDHADDSVYDDAWMNELVIHDLTEAGELSERDRDLWEKFDAQTSEFGEEKEWKGPENDDEDADVRDRDAARDEL